MKRYQVLVGILTIAGMAACTKDNPNYCAGDEDCPGGRCDPDTHECVNLDGSIDAGDARADAGDARVDAADAEMDAGPECVTSSDCTDPAKPICDGGSCRACESNEECGQAHPDKPVCDASGECISATCGNGTIEPGEECDATDLGGATCESVTGLQSGTLACTNTCRYDTSDCHTCGNGVAEGPELCDGTDVRGQTCSDVSSYEQGELRCNTDCTLDLSLCHTCGNGTIEGGEECDGSQMGSGTCQSETGLSQGSLSCTSDCHYDTSDCHECGDGIRQGPEQCDGDDLGGQTCATASSYQQGDLACTSSCTFDTSGCYTCGNGTIEGPEVCDGTNLAGQTCQSPQQGGFQFGELRCSADCLNFDNSDCNDCGDGVCQHDRRDSTSTCPEDCGWVDVTAGGDFTCGVKADNTLWCWGRNDHHQLGPVAGNASSVPVQVQLPLGPTEEISHVSSGGDHTCSVTHDTVSGEYELYCWGSNAHGQCAVSPIGGDVSSPFHVTAVDVVSPYVGTGSDFTCVHGGDMNIYCWGANWQGQLGDGTVGDDRATPECAREPRHNQCFRTELIGFAKSIGYHMCLGAPGLYPIVGPMTFCWGRNTVGQVGTGTAGGTVNYPTAIFDDDMQTAGGLAHTCGVVDGSVYCWGANGQGQLGMGDTQSRYAPTQVGSLTGIAAIAAGAYFSCATSGTQTWCWGDNYYGQLGTGDGLDHSSPTLVAALNNANVVALTAGGFHTCVVLGDGTMRCWGRNDYGQLGDGTTVNRSTPVLVSDPYGP